MKNILMAPTVTTFNALILALTAKLAELSGSTILSRRQELLDDTGRIGEQIGSDVVQHVSLLVARQLDVVLSLYDGRGCSKSRLTINTQLDQLIRMRGIAPCPFCEELLVDSDQQAVAAVYA